MSTKINSKHPYWFVRSFVERYFSEIHSFHFSYYDYIPQSLLDNRIMFSVTSKNFMDVEVISSFLQAVPENKELAFHSLVTMNDGVNLHIPMIDMFTNSVAQLTKLKPFLGEEFFKYFKWYRSGRSFHGYANTLIDSQEWAAFMGTLLLVNQQGFVPTVDPRWIGHRLIAGYSALRWTKNTQQYLEAPKAID